ncbi:hypothetical protein LWM68_40920 [Niabella sp. W65]|nr:hypothetical protein [Niabella sp. W65]MCH7368536.1 hypothetical protein [Niabella sp. W65]
MTYKGNPEGLQAWLETLKPQQRIVNSLDDAPNAERVAVLMAKSGDELFKGGGFNELKALSIEHFKAKYKEWTGKDYQG